MFFKNYKKWETEFAGRPFSLETGKMAGVANSAFLASYGASQVLCTVTASAKPREGVDFFPLSVDYEEKMYSVGRIPAPSSAVRAEQVKRLSFTTAALTDRFVLFSPRTSETIALLLQP
jgi:polyribonucleotide nucleotidyltransferase